MFDQVIAVDKQLHLLRCAAAHPRLQYVAAAAERLPLPSGRADLLTVAQALHHLDLPRFYMEAGRVLRQGGIIAAWCFGEHQLARNIDCYYHSIYETLESYWPPERQLVVSGYSGLPFPFERIASPELTVSVRWRQEDFHVYLRSWTAFRRYVNEGNPDPLTHMPRDFWANSEERQPVSWPIHLLVGRAGVCSIGSSCGHEHWAQASQ
jgi:SAM-dependent methyltransferase